MSFFYLQFLSILLLISGILAQTRTICGESWRNIYQHTDSSGIVWKWDLNPLCIEGGSYSYDGPGTSGQIVHFNIGGNASVGCTDYTSAPDAAEYESWGAVVQELQLSRGSRTNGGCLRPDNTTCTDWTFGGDICCSIRRCEVVAFNIFTFDLIDPENAATGGIILQYAGYPDREDDDLACPYQAPGLRRLRTVILQLDCDPNGPVDNITVTYYDESHPYCTFRIHASTKAACGIPQLSPSPSFTPSRSRIPMSPSSLPPVSTVNTGVGPAGQFGFVVLGASLLGGVQVLSAFYGATILEKIKSFGFLTSWQSTSLTNAKFPSAASSSSYAVTDHTPLYQK